MVLGIMRSSGWGSRLPNMNGFRCAKIFALPSVLIGLLVSPLTVVSSTATSGSSPSPGLTLQVYTRAQAEGQPVARIVGEQHAVRSGDGIQIRVSTTTDAYVYVVIYGSTHSASLLYPTSERSADAHMQAGEQRVIPGPGAFLPLDDNVGRETIFAFSADTALDEVSSVLVRMEAYADDLGAVTSVVSSRFPSMARAVIQHLAPAISDHGLAQPEPAAPGTVPKPSVAPIAASKWGTDSGDATVLKSSGSRIQTLLMGATDEEEALLRPIEPAPSAATAVQSESLAATTAQHDDVASPAAPSLAKRIKSWFSFGRKKGAAVDEEPLLEGGNDSAPEEELVSEIPESATPFALMVDRQASESGPRQGEVAELFSPNVSLLIAESALEPPVEHSADEPIGASAVEVHATHDVMEPALTPEQEKSLLADPQLTGLAEALSLNLDDVRGPVGAPAQSVVVDDDLGPAVTVIEEQESEASLAQRAPPLADPLPGVIEKSTPAPPITESHVADTGPAVDALDGDSSPVYSPDAAMQGINVEVTELSIDASEMPVVDGSSSLALEEARHAAPDEPKTEGAGGESKSKLWSALTRFFSKSKSEDAEEIASATSAGSAETVVDDVAAISSTESPADPRALVIRPAQAGSSIALKGNREQVLTETHVLGREGKKIQRLLDGEEESTAATIAVVGEVSDSLAVTASAAAFGYPAVSVPGVTAEWPDISLDRLPDIDMTAADNVSSSVVLIVTPNGVGSGAILDETGRIVTNWHVVKGQPAVSVLLKSPTGSGADQEPRYVARITRLNKFSDLALLQLVDPPKGLRPVAIAHEPALKRGQAVHAVGHPRGSVWTHTVARVTNVRADSTWHSGNNITHRGTVIKAQVAANPGSSGAPLFNRNFQMVGISAAPGRRPGQLNALALSSILEFLGDEQSSQLVASDQ